jgi:hypothetical protein
MQYEFHQIRISSLRGLKCKLVQVEKVRELGSQSLWNCICIQIRIQRFAFKNTML